ncbi:AlkA N-terminal domain-containing protein [Aeromonas rivuli]|uniref:AlkA N-terminal domain-containing protein n=1 Tax=Aeromonas rivuli TaxID=648794 RepID=UPI001CC96B95|nr:AlkA N-terminal domain-containing protein [Aeromonas rivuli]UBO75053.1 helix-turn-helix domain-containing protein [Aeromonas rivuli]
MASSDPAKRAVSTSTTAHVVSEGTAPGTDHAEAHEQARIGLSRAECLEARLAHDARFDGRFFTGVLSTGIYCRPICPARAPLERNVRYFQSAANAEQFGLRPCLRCRPELAPGLQQVLPEVLTRALRAIDSGMLAEQSLAQLARALGVTERTLRRQFEQHLGAAPMQIEQTRRLLLAKRLLADTRLPITEIAYAAGFTSIRRFNDAWQHAYGMAPRTQRAASSYPSLPELKGETTLTLRLAYRPPYDVHAMLAFYRLRAIPGLERAGADFYERRHRVQGSEGWIRVEPGLGHSLNVTLSGVALRALPDILHRVRRMWDLDADLGQISAHLTRDPLLARLAAHSPGVRLPAGWSDYEVLLRAIVGQQVSVKGAITIMGRLVARTEAQFGEAALPTPAQLCALDLDGIGMPGSRIRTLQGVAAAMVSGALVLEGDCDEALLALPGIGPWTIAYWRLRTGRDTDAFPASDLVLQKALGTGQKLPVPEMETRSQPWHPWRAYAASWLWHAMSVAPELLGIESGPRPKRPKSAPTTATPDNPETTS